MITYHRCRKCVHVVKNGLYVTGCKVRDHAMSDQEAKRHEPCDSYAKLTEVKARTCSNCGERCEGSGQCGCGAKIDE